MNPALLHMLRVRFTLRMEAGSASMRSDRALVTFETPLRGGMRGLRPMIRQRRTPSNEPVLAGIKRSVGQVNVSEAETQG